ncbi:ImmA/IrrE family metallo-endopeptidase [Bradyrhizobium yuanmingense]|uniref:ImmA/IrrE family metallo-endopeptidase n=1 Tax=Bradyrhizobium yuanmingense TaxID=108015 RepID=UPI0021A8F288|nr:ImmA/IrrE family metallo-endopeptidase [Bradyrhizobium sp. CB1024]UWU87780.1 ImmA/IrrE family metallo-endopeptidase [Bradyrhizobium sp. CB1024]
MQSDYKVRYLHDDIIAAAAESCWRHAPPERPHTFDVIKLLEVLVTAGIDHVFHIKGDRKKGPLEIEFFDRRRRWQWERPAWVTFDKKVKLVVDSAIWEAATLGKTFASFVLAHEAGHILLHDSSAKAFSSSKSDQLSFVDEGESAEEQANSFAGHLLVPTRTVHRFPDKDLLAAVCNVPDELAADRLAAVSNAKAILAQHRMTDYCRGCGRFTEVALGICQSCTHDQLQPTS